MTVKEVAEAMSVQPATVRAWLRSGRMKGTRIGRDWRIPSRVVHAATSADILDRLADALRALPADRAERFVDHVEAMARGESEDE